MVDFKLNFDGLKIEFVIFFFCLLYILLNGLIGIVVGMVIDIFFYNINELVDVCVMLLDNLNVILMDILSVV